MIIRTITPPPGSAITVSSDGAPPVITIPQPRGGYSRWFTGAFLLAWLGGWIFGFKAALSQIMSGKGEPFLIVWLAVWTVGGCFVVFIIARIFRPSLAETLALGADGVAFDSGIPPYRQGMLSTDRNAFWKSAFQRRTRVTIGRQDLRSLRLRETDSGNRLTVDVASKRVDLALGASEVEREWLYRLLAERYGVAAG